MCNPTGNPAAVAGGRDGSPAFKWRNLTIRDTTDMSSRERNDHVKKVPKEGSPVHRDWSDTASADYSKTDIAFEAPDRVTSEKPMSSNTQTASIEALLDEYAKQTLVANAWLVAPGVRYQDVADLLQTSDEHARRTFRALEAGDIAIDSVAKPAVQTQLGELLEEAGALADVAGPVAVRTSREDVPEWWQTGNQTPSTAESNSQAEAGEATLPGTAKERLLAAWRIVTDAGDEVVNRELAAVADCSEEHARRTRNAIEAGDIDEAEFDAINDAVWDVVAERLMAEDVIDSPTEFQDREESLATSIKRESADTDDTAESVAEGSTMAQTTTTTVPESLESAEFSDAPARDEMIPARDVQRVRDILDVLRREAETTGDVKATFVANEAVIQLTQLLNNAESADDG